MRPLHSLLLSLFVINPLLAVACNPAPTGPLQTDPSASTLADAAALPGLENPPVPQADAGTADPEDASPAADAGTPDTPSAPVDDDAAATARLCGSNSDCENGLYCRKTACSDAAGTCAPMPAYSSCALDPNDPGVCGCDHLNYASACEAASAGAAVGSIGECPPLPSGPCTSQSDCGDPSYDALVFCKPTTCGRAGGVCTPRPWACPNIMDIVCSCDGTAFRNSCYEDEKGLGLAYGGPCRSGELHACDAANPCADGQVCAVDPRAACAPGQECPGICLDTSGASCGPAHWSDAGVTSGCGSATQACVPMQGCTGDGCDRCVYTTGARCGGGASCPGGQICVSPLDCEDGGACGACAVP